MIKFPKTPRLSAVMGGDVVEAWKHTRAVVEEKVDGANVGIWFEGNEIRLQSRGHVLRGGPTEKQFAPFHGWAAARLWELKVVLGERFVVYGEWCFAKHRAYYDALPDWLIGYDVLDRETDRFLGVVARDKVLADCRVTIVSKLWQGAFNKAPAFGSLVGKSRYKSSAWRIVLTEEARRAGIGSASYMDETDDSEEMEGVYVRVEDETGVIGRMKAHRAGYEKVRSDHWRDRPLIKNRLHERKSEF